MQKKSFIDHLEELRRRILISAAGVLTASAAALFFHKSILNYISRPLEKGLVMISPQEAFMVTIKVSLIAGAVFSSPLVIYQAWRFVSEGLYMREKKVISAYVPVSVLLFMSGVAFGFYVVLPAGLDFLLGMGGALITPMISADRYVSFTMVLLLVFGTTFQLPVFMRGLTRTGIVSRKQLRSTRRYAVVVIFTAAAVLTPPDIFTQIALALPVIILYEAGIIFSYGKKRKFPQG